MMRFTTFLVAFLSIALVESSDSSSHGAIAGDSHTLFATFEGNNRSYVMVFKSVIGDAVRDHDYHCNGRLHNAPAPLFDALMEECKQYGTINPTLEPAAPTNQLLVASPYYNCGQDFIFTDVIDKQDQLQSCLQYIQGAAIDRGFAFPLDSKGKVIDSKVSAAPSSRTGGLGLALSALCLGLALLM